MRFWSNGIQVEDPGNPGNPLEIASPYTEAELRDIQYIQINDVLYLAHPNRSPRKLTRVADDNWTIAVVSWEWPTMLDENITTTTITPSAVTGNITLTASASTFSASHVGAYFQIGHQRANAFQEEAIDGTGATAGLEILGAWEFTTTGTWTATINIERSYDAGSTWEIIRTYRGASDRNVTTTGNEERQCLIRVNISAYTTGTGTRNARLEATESRIYGFALITAFTSATVVSATVIKTLGGAGATTFWSEGAFSALRGRPRTVTLHEGRVFFGGTSYRPLSMWGSVVDDYENFRVTSQDDGGLFFSLAGKQANAIQWLESQGDSLLIGTSGDEWTLSASDSASALTPSNVQARRQSSYGSKFIQANLINDVLLFIQRQGRKVRELVYQFEKDGWVAPDLTVLAEHVTDGEILEIAYQQQPDAILWAIRGDGQLVGMTYERDQSVVGWHRHITDGEFESVATIYGNGTADEVWFVVKRTINGNTARYIERFKPDAKTIFDDEDKDNWWYLDCAKRSTDVSTVTGLTHIEGETVDILTDGAAHPERTVASGSVTLAKEYGTVLVGLPFVSTVKPMKLELQLQDGASRGRPKRVHRLIISFLKSLGGEYSTDGATWDKVVNRQMGDPMDASSSPFTGDKEVITAGDYSRNGDIQIRQTQPFPLTLLALTAKLDAYGD